MISNIINSQTAKNDMKGIGIFQFSKVYFSHLTVNKLLPKHFQARLLRQIKTVR